VRQPIRAMVAAVLAVAAILVAAAVTSSAATRTPSSEHTSEAPGMGSGSEAPPVAGTPGKDCGEITTGSGPDATVSFEPCGPPSTEPLDPHPQLVVPRSGMSDVRPVGFDSATIRDDDRTVDVRFWSGIEPCAVLDHVDVAYGAQTVTITLIEGADPGAGLVALLPWWAGVGARYSGYRAGDVAAVVEILRSGGAEVTDRHRELAAEAGASQVEAALRG